MSSCFITSSCSNVGVIILLPLMAIPSMIAILSLNDQYGCNSFCTPVYVDGQPCSMSSANVLRCLSYGVTSLISSAVMQSGMSIYGSIALMVMYFPGISSSLLVFWLALIAGL